MRYSDVMYAMDEFYLEGGFEASLDLIGQHDSRTTASCLEVRKSKGKEEEHMGYPKDSCQKLRDLLGEVNAGS